MYKYLIICILISAFSWNATSQNRKAMSKEITAKMAFFKKDNDKRKIQFKDSIKDKSLFKLISNKELTKDSLRIILVDDGYNDYDFECFILKLKNINEFNEAFVKHKYPQLFKQLADSTYNKVTYSYEQSTNGIDVSLMISKNIITMDSIAEISATIGPGYSKQYIILRGYSYKDGLSYYENSDLKNIADTLKVTKITLDGENRFKIEIENYETKKTYISIKDINGKTLSLSHIH